SMQLSATRHSSLISRVLTAGGAGASASTPSADASGGETCDGSVEATTKGFGSSALAVVSAAFSGAGRGVLAAATAVDAAGDNTRHGFGSEATTNDFACSRPTVLSMAFSGAATAAATSTVPTTAFATTVACGITAGSVLATGVASWRSTIDFAPAFSMEAATVFPIEVEPKPASQANTQLARPEPARKLIRRCADVANRQG